MNGKYLKWYSNTCKGYFALKNCKKVLLHCVPKWHSYYCTKQLRRLLNKS